jgi:putative hydrolase of HD superfamily
VTLLTLLFTLVHEKDNNFRITALERALFHDVPESLTGDIISPVKDIIKKEYSEHEKDIWSGLEKELAIIPIQELTGKSPKLLKYINEKHLLEEVNDKEKDSEASLVKDCDRMALAIECIQEGLTTKLPREMSKVYHDYLEDLQNSEWQYIREFAAKLATRYPLVSSTD